MDLKKHIETLYLYTRKATLTAEEHENCRNVAAYLIEQLSPKAEDPENPKKK